MAEKLVINGGKKLFGKVQIDGSKNAFLPILASCLLTEEDVVLKRCPQYTDIHSMVQMLKILGAKAEFVGNDLHINCKNVKFYTISEELTKTVRSSVFLFGALLGRTKKARLSYPGGCDIGLRPVDMHLKALKQLGVSVEEMHGFIYCDSSNFLPGEVFLDYPSVGVTENLMMLACISCGITIVQNAAKEPEVEDLQNFLNSMGAKVSGAGTSVIKIEGVSKLSGTTYAPIPDRILCGTLLAACAMTGGKIELCGCEPKHFLSIIDKLLKTSCKICINNDKIKLSSNGCLTSFGELETGPYPSFPTDMQTQMLTLSTIAKGNTIIVENVFESRFKVVPELLKMGANIRVKGKTAYIKGVSNLFGATIYPRDLRGAASLVLAGLCAKGYTTVYDLTQLDRGYDHFETILSGLGADIHRIS